MAGQLIVIGLFLLLTLGCRCAAQFIAERRVVAERSLQGELADIDRYYGAIKSEVAFPNRQ